MYSLVLFDTYALGGSDRDLAHVFCKSRTMVLLLEMGLEPMSSYTARKLEIHPYDVLMSCIGYTK